MKTKWFLFAAMVCVVLPGCATFKAHPDFAERHQTMQSLSVLPPDVTAYRMTFNQGNQLVPEIIPVLEKASLDQSIRTLEEKGYEVRPLNLTEEELAKNPELRSAIHEVRGLFTKACEDIAKNKKTEFTYTLGSSVNIFADRTDVNALMIARQVGIKKSGGELSADVTKSILVGAMTLGAFVPTVSNSSMMMEVAIIDANLGDVLWYNLALTQNTGMFLMEGDDPWKEKCTERFIRDLLKPFPDSKFKTKTEAPKKIVSVTSSEIKEAAPAAPRKNNFGPAAAVR